MLAKKAKEVLTVLQEKGLLKDLILIGSWCCHFYVSYFGREHYAPTIQTLDIDFLIPDLKRLRSKSLNLPSLLKGLDFDSEFDFSGWLRFIHPELRVEFLIPRLGPQPDDPRKIPQLEITAMPLRHTHVLTKYALHKLFVSYRRKEKGKAIRDREMALRILSAVQMTGKTEDVASIWGSFTKKEQRVILGVIEKEDRKDLLPLLV